MYDAARKTRNGLVDARRRLRRDLADWSELSEEDLLRQLINRKVVTLESTEKLDGENHVGTESMEKAEQSFKCSDGLIGLCQRFGLENKHQPTSGSK